MTGKVQKDHSSYCPGGDCTCPPITKSKELGIKKLIKAIDKEKQENKAKPENLRKPVHLNIAKAPKKVTPKVIFWDKNRVSKYWNNSPVHIITFKTNRNCLYHKIIEWFFWRQLFSNCSKANLKTSSISHLSVVSIFNKTTFHRQIPPWLWSTVSAHIERWRSIKIQDF